MWQRLQLVPFSWPLHTLPFDRRSNQQSRSKLSPGFEVSLVAVVEVVVVEMDGIKICKSYRNMTMSCVAFDPPDVPSHTMDIVNVFIVAVFIVAVFIATVFIALSRKTFFRVGGVRKEEREKKKEKRNEMRERRKWVEGIEIWIENWSSKEVEENKLMTVSIQTHAQINTNGSFSHSYNFIPSSSFRTVRFIDGFSSLMKNSSYALWIFYFG